jgi:hypothetical protein
MRSRHPMYASGEITSHIALAAQCPASRSRSQEPIFALIALRVLEFRQPIPLMGSSE